MRWATSIRSAENALGQFHIGTMWLSLLIKISQSNPIDISESMPFASALQRPPEVQTCVFEVHREAKRDAMHAGI